MSARQFRLAQRSPRALRIYPLCVLRATPFALFSYFKSLLPGGLKKLNHLQGRSQLQHSCDPYFRISAIIVALTVQLPGGKERLSERCRCQRQQPWAAREGRGQYRGVGSASAPGRRASFPRTPLAEQQIPQPFRSGAPRRTCTMPGCCRRCSSVTSFSSL